MEYRVYGNDLVIRIERGEEILESLQTVCRREGITLGSVSGLGAVGEATLGVFNRDTFAYEQQTFTGDLEIAACGGSVSTMEGKIYLHLHMVVSNVTKGICHGGHLSRGVVSLTGEFLLHKIDGQVERAYSPEVGLNLFRFLEDGEDRDSQAAEQEERA